jgi:hypothetical protein
VTDYLKPDLDEIWGVLPDRLVRPIARWAERRWPHGRPTVGQHVRTTTISGFLRVWLLARLKRLRPISYRAREEHARIARWLDAVQTCAGADPSVAAEVAQAAQLVKGYGDVRRRMFAVHEQIVAGVLRAVTLEAPRREGFTVSTRAGRAPARARAAGPRRRRPRARHDRRHPRASGDRRRAGALEPLAAASARRLSSSPRRSSVVQGFRDVLDGGHERRAPGDLTHPIGARHGLPRSACLRCS